MFQFGPFLLFLMASLPFVIPYQYRPNPVFPSEAIALLLMLLLSGRALIKKHTSTHLAFTQCYWLIFALFLGIQWGFLTPLYNEFTLIALLFVLTAAAASFALMQYRETYGLVSLCTPFLWGLVAGCLINTGIAFSQVYMSLTLEKAQLIYGGIGQRNMYANYLMGGFIAWIYLAQYYQLKRKLTIPLMCWFALSLAWAGSRALLMYMAAITLVSLWMYWKKPHLRRFCRGLLLGMALILLALWLVPYLNALMGGLLGHHAQVPTALDRLTANGGRRLVEWQKAWQIFQMYPWFGAGWGGFAGHSLELHANTPGFYKVIESVLFTHAHNSPLHLLAENGLIGGIVILGGLLYLFATCCFQIDHPAKLALLLILLVTTLHSFVEYPLWYFHFFAIFVICLGLLVTRHTTLKRGGVLIRSYFAIYIVLAITCVGWGFMAYSMLYHWQRPSYTEEKNAQRLDTLNLLQKNPLLDFHAALTASHYIDANKENIETTLALLTPLNQTRPYPWQLMDEAILYARQGEITAAQYALKRAMYSYPDSLPYFEKRLQESPYPQVKALMQDTQQAKRIFSQKG